MGKKENHLLKYLTILDSLPFYTQGLIDSIKRLSLSSYSGIIVGKRKAEKIEYLLSRSIVYLRINSPFPTQAFCTTIA